jgi:hypothetical protein
MISVEILIIIASLCTPVGKTSADVQEAIRCNETIIQCTQSKLSTLTPEKFNMCIMEYELSKK